MFLLALTSGISLGMISPLVNLLFQRPYSGSSGFFMGPLIEWIHRWSLSLTPLFALQRLAFLLILVFFLKGIFGYLQRYLSILVVQGVVKDLRNRLYSHFHSLPLRYFHKSQVGTLTARITHDVHLVQGAVNDGVITLIRESFLVLAYLGVTLWASWRLSFISALLIPGAVGIILLMGTRLRKRSTRIQERMADISSTITETLSGIRVVKSFSMERSEIKKFFNHTWNYYKAFLRFEQIGLLGPPLTEFLGVLVAGAILWYGGYEILVAETLSPDRFFVFLAASLSMMQPVKRISQANVMIQHGLAAAERIFSILDQKPEIVGQGTHPIPSRSIWGRGWAHLLRKGKPEAVSEGEPIRLVRLQDGIRLKGVSFEYEAGKKVLDRIDLEISCGEVVALVGPSGAGKSTLVDLIFRFYDPTEGAIEMDGKDLRKMDLVNLRGLFGIVPQEVILFNDSLQNNISYGKNGASIVEVIEAAKKANAHNFILGMKKGYETNVGERGANLSGGERQRIAIARALLKDPQILIFDEATSSLDSEAERLVQEAIDRLMKERTVIVIAHRLSTVRQAHKIVVLDKGRILQQGTHDSLLAQGGMYRRLYENQFRTMLT
ncbi:ABC transporter ATP-binding protein [candidate division TA06 bacterium]|nr:ABC transporter ATP-binding protein [candidate division TA06 bacterium]